MHTTHHSEETKLKISETLKRLYCEGKRVSKLPRKPNETSFKKGCVAWNKGKTGQKGHPPWNKGKKFTCVSSFKIGCIPWNKGKPYPHEGCPKSQKTRNKISETRKKRFTDGTLRISEEVKQKIREKRIKQVLPTKDTSIEVKMQNELKRRSIDFLIHIPFHKYHLLACQPDIVIPSKRIVIQCDGVHWHNFPHGLEKDKKQDKVLRELGWKVYRFWEHEVNEDVESCVDKIQGDLIKI